MLLFLLVSQCPTPAGAGGTGTSALFTPNGAQATTDQGDYISSSGGLNAPFRYFVEVPPGLGRLRVRLFDADIGAGATADRARGAFDSSAIHRVFGPDGVQRPSLLSPGTATGPAGADGAWLDLYDIVSGGNDDRVRDQFGAAAYNNNDGNINWGTNWVEADSAGGGAGGGNILITGGLLRIRQAASAPASVIQRQADLTGWANAVFSFDFSTSTNVDAGDQMRVQVSSNGGGSWTTLETFTGPFTTTESRAYDISGFVAVNTRVRFIHVATYSGTESFFVDNVQIQNPSLPNGHWEVQVDMSTAANPTTGDDINALGLQADDGDDTAAGTELNVYYDSQTTYGNHGSVSEPDPRSYLEFPYVTSGCSCSSNDWDSDDVGTLSYASRSGAFTQSFSDAQLSTNDVWVRNTITGWTTDASSVDYGVWTLNLAVSQPAGGANYTNAWLGNFQAAANPPAANPTANALRVYLPTDGSVAPVKPYLEQLLTHVLGPNPPIVGGTTYLSVTVRVVNPTNRPIEFSASNLVTANVPGPAMDVTYQGNAQISQGSLTGEPAVGGIGNVTWDPGTLAAGATGLLAYRVAVTPTASPQRIPVTGVVSTGTGADGTRARFVDETGNTTQARATYRLGPVCELAASVNVLTPAVVSSVRAKDSGRGVIVEWDTVSEVGTIGFDLLRWDRDSAQYVKVNDKLLMGLVASPQGGRYRFVDPGASRFGTHTYVLSEVEASGSRRYHGPFQAKVEAATSRDTAISAEGYERAPRRMTAALGRTLNTRRQEAAVTALAAARATAPAMKIGVEAPGVYRVPAASIAATLGLPLSRVQSLIASHRFALSHRGRPVAWMPALSDGLLFYGEGIESIYTRDNVYWLRQGSGLRMGSVVGGTPSPVPEQSFQDARHTEQDRLAATIVSSDPESDYWYWDYLSGGDPTHGRKSFPVLAEGLASGGGAASLRVGLHGATSTGVANEHHVVLRLNGVSVGEARWQGIAPQTIDVSIGSSLLQEGENTVEAEALLESGVPYSIVYVDAIDLSYPRRYQAEADALAFRSDGHPVVTVDSFSDGRIVVLDLTDPLRPKRVVRVTTDMRPQGRFLVSFIPSTPETPYVAVAPPGWRSPKWVKADLPSRLKARNQGADHVIVTTQELLAPAKRLESLREGQGLRSIVVDLQDVMDEFGDGIDSPHAIKAFLAYARLHWSPAPRFVLLAGAGSFDYKDNLGLGGNLVPPLMAGTPSGLFASDNRFVDLDGDDLVPEIAIGRVPALTAAELDAYISKIQAYEASDGAGWKQRALWVADNPEGAANFPADATRVALNLLPGYAPEAIYLAEGTITASRTQLLNGFANGASLLNYVGHGGLDRLASEGLLVTADAEALANGERLPVVTALTCIINRFEVPGFVPLGAALVKNGAGGASAVWAPTGLSMNAEAIVLGARFYSEHSSAPDERVGEIVRRSLEAYAGADRERSLLNVYNLFGDPALLFKPPDPAPGGGPDALSRSGRGE